MPRRLEGAGIVVTRPAGADDRLARLLAAGGARVLAFPAFSVAPLESPMPAGAFAAALFTSPAAVRFGWPRLTGVRPKLLLAPGGGTRASLAAAGATGIQMPARGAGLDALLDALPADLLAGKRLLLVCGEPLNRASLRKLAARGAEVAPFPVYARRATRNPQPLTAWIRDGEADAIMASSVAAIEALHELLGDNAGRLDWIVSSRRVADAAQRRGTKPLFLAASAGADDMAAAAADWWQAKDAHDRQA